MGRLLTMAICIALTIAVACFYGYAAYRFQTAVNEKVATAMKQMQ